jgi:predicted ABC-type transport system involved in lysophospholipase L1 biosynthesis ATPase subunit
VAGHAAAFIGREGELGALIDVGARVARAERPTAVVVVGEPGSGKSRLLAEACARTTILARLGVTNVALLRDEHTVCIVLEGWAFDPAGSASEVVSTFSDGRRSGRALQPVMQVAVEGSSGIG